MLLLVVLVVLVVLLDLLDPLQQTQLDMAEPEGSSTVTSCENASPCSPPSFVKTMRSFNFYKGALELPAAFVKEHGRRFQKVVLLQGPSGKTTSVQLRVRLHGQERVELGGAHWKAFVVANGFERVSIPNSSHTRVDMRSGARPSAGKNHVKNDVVYTSKALKYKADTEALLENLRCPHFVSVMGLSSLRDYGSNALCVPAKFLEKYGEYLTEFHYLQGPKGHSVEVRFSSGPKGARFTTGWKTFNKENGIQLGDVLLFSLQAPTRWLVQVVESRSSEDPGIGELCNRSDLD